MISNLTLITSIVLTAGLATAGTYYAVTHLPANGNEPETVVTQQVIPQPVPAKPIQTTATNQQQDKPPVVVVKTEINHYERKKKHIDYIAEGRQARSRPQPKLHVYN